MIRGGLSLEIVAREAVYQLGNIYSPGNGDADEHGRLSVNVRAPNSSDALEDYSSEVLIPAILLLSVELCRLGSPKIIPASLIPGNYNYARVTHGRHSLLVMKEFCLREYKEIICIIVCY